MTFIESLMPVLEIMDRLKNEAPDMERELRPVLSAAINAGEAEIGDLQNQLAMAEARIALLTAGAPAPVEPPVTTGT